MSEPLVCAIMLVNGREAMVRRAVASFRAQSYENKALVVWDTGASRVPVDQQSCDRISWWTGDHKSIGALRNDAIGWALDGPTPRPEIFVTFDSDDVSNEHRIAEQVALLEASGADCVGYYEAPFWDTRPGAFCGAWLYRDPARKHVLGASMCYWRKTRERRPFDDINTGEDTRFAGRCKTVAVSACEDLSGLRINVPQIDVTRGGLFGGPADTHRRYISGPPEISIGKGQPCAPRIVCGIHGSNTSGGYDFTKRQQCFTRAPQFDDYCRGVMQL